MIENDIIEIQDKFLIDDDHSKVRGFVACYDENDNRIFLRENMIVISGRKKILECLRKSSGSITRSFFDGMAAFLDTSTAITSPTMEFDSTKGSFGGLSYSDLAVIQRSTTGPIKIESLQNEHEAYTQVFTAGNYYYIDNITETVGERETNITILTKAIQIYAGQRYYYTISQVANRSDIQDNGKYFFVNTEKSGRLEKSVRPLDDFDADKTIYSISFAASAAYNPDKKYYYHDTISGVEDYYESLDNYLDTTKNYFIRNAKSDIDFSLVECFKIIYNPSAANMSGQLRFGSLGLYFPGPGNDPNDEFAGATLFSRVTFPPYSARTRLKFYYYLYF